MDLKTVQQELKADIAKHQTIMMKLKENPQDQYLRDSLKVIQKHIAQLGSIQKQLAKPKKGNNLQKDTTTNTATNGANSSDPKTIPQSGFVKLEPKNMEENGKVTFRISDFNTLLCTQDPQNTSTIHSDTSPFTNSDVNVENKLPITDDGVKCEEKNESKPTECEKPIKTGNISVSSPENPSQIQTPPSKTSNCQTSVHNSDPDATNTSAATVVCNSQPLIANSNQHKKINIARGIIPTSNSKKILVKSPMKIRVPVPISNSGQLILLPTTTVKSKVSVSTPLLRWAPCELKPSSGPARVWFSVAGTSGSPPRQRLIPTTVQSNQMLQPIGTFQKFRIIGGKNASVKPIPPTIQTSTVDCKPRTTHLKAEMMKVSPSTSVKESASKSPEQENKPIKLLPDFKKPRVDDVTNTTPVKTEVEVSKEERNSYATNARPYAAVPECLNKKIDFLAFLSLITIEKAEKLRNRRSGRRRVAAHPVYSGGLYVSTTAAESSKRIIPPELLGIDGVPVKRPRGRPRGTTNKRSISPAQPRDQEEEEFQKIFRETRPSTSAGEGDGKVKKVKKKADEHEDLCAICGKAGEVLMCDTCSRVYHVTCLIPPLKEVPKGMWFCDSCKEKLNDRNGAPAWPGLMSIVHSYIAHDARREETLARCREKLRTERAKKNKLESQLKILSSMLREKISTKHKIRQDLQTNLDTCEKLTSVLERVRCAVNKTLDTT